METARMKRLDELFADEPHLSPTMKARRLHEKMDANAAGKAQKAPVVPPLPPTFGTQTVSLARAAEILRHSAEWTAPPDAETMRLFRFRETVLTQWLADAPELRRESQTGGGRSGSGRNGR